MRTLPCFTLLLLVAPAALAQETQPAKKAKVDEAKVQRLIEIANEVTGEVEALRGWKFKKPVKKGVHTEDQLREFIRKKLLEEELGGGKLERYQWMLTSLGFLPKDMDLGKTLVDVLLSQVGGFYDPDRGSFFMMEKAAEYGESVNRMMIAHELTHALDDQYYDLNPLMKAREDEHDASFAIGAVVEGSATALMQRWAQKYGMTKYNMASEIKEVMKREAEKAEVLISAPPYFATLVARYMGGLFFLTKGKGQLGLARMKDGVAKTADRAFTEVPLSSEQILHPDKYWDPEKLDVPVKLVDEDVFAKDLEAALGAKVVDRDTLGEIHMALLARRPDKKLNMGLMVNASYWTNRAARGWGGDRVFLMKKGEEKGIVWYTWWDTAKDAEEFERAYLRHYGKRTGFGHGRIGRMAVFTYGFAQPLADKLRTWGYDRSQLVKGEKPFPIDE